MEERLRLAYLAAMDIPVWLLREAGERVEEEQAVVVEPRREAPMEPGARRARELLGDIAPAPSAPASAPVRVVRMEREARVRDRVELLLALGGRTLFIEQAPPPRESARVLELLGAIGSALEGTRVSAAAHPFSWPPQGIAFDPVQARDMVLGMMSKLRLDSGYTRVALMGEAPAALLLGWSAEQYAARSPCWHRLDGCDASVVVTCAAGQMLREPSAKATAWRELRPPEHD